MPLNSPGLGSALRNGLEQLHLHGGAEELLHLSLRETRDDRMFWVRRVKLKLK